MIRVISCLTTQHDLRLVALAALVCLLTVFTAFMTFGHVLDRRNPRRHLWLIVTGFCSATGIWATHFVAMLAYRSGLPISFDPQATAASFLLALVFTTSSFWLLAQAHWRGQHEKGAVRLQNQLAREFAQPVSRSSISALFSGLSGRQLALLAGAIAGGGISLMHFTGMAAVRAGGVMSWDLGLAGAALAMGIVFGAAAMLAKLSADRRISSLLAPLLLVLAIVAMHFTAMGAATLTPDPRVAAPSETPDILPLALSIAALTTAVIFACFPASLLETSAQNRKLNADLARKLVELKDAQDDIVRKGRMAQLGNLTATVAHEIRNPLATIRTSSFLLERKIKGKGLGVEAQLERINAGVMRCDSIITQLLDFARNAPLQLGDHDLDAWLEKIVEEEAQKLPAAVAIECHLDLAGIVVNFDAGRLQRVIINLLSNASEAMVGRGDDPSQFVTKAPTIVVATAFDDRGVEIRVTDNGPGMAAEILARIREPLFTTKSFGTGLGIPAVERIVEQHGGTFDIASAPGNGTSVTIRLPAVPAKLQAA